MFQFLIALIGIPLLGFLTFVVFYAITALCLSIIPVNKKYCQPINGIQIWVVSDGIHADFIMPASNAAFDWWKILGIEHYGASKKDITYLCFGWGDKGFYMEIPTWDDLTLKIAAKAVLVPSSTCMHVTAHTKLPDRKYSVPILVNDEKYKQLCHYILNYFEKDTQQRVIRIPEYSFSDLDCFYEGTGSYHCFNTCNYWVSRGLKKIGVTSPVWSPLAKGIFYQLERVG